MSHWAEIDLEMKCRPCLMAALERQDAKERVKIKSVDTRGDSVIVRLDGWLGAVRFNTKTGKVGYDEDNLQKWRGEAVADQRWRQLEDLKMFYTAEQAKLTAEENNENWEELWDDDGDLAVVTTEGLFDS